LCFDATGLQAIQQSIHDWTAVTGTLKRKIGYVIDH